MLSMLKEKLFGYLEGLSSKKPAGQEEADKGKTPQDSVAAPAPMTAAVSPLAALGSQVSAGASFFCAFKKDVQPFKITPNMICLHEIDEGGGKYLRLFNGMPASPMTSPLNRSAAYAGFAKPRPFITVTPKRGVEFRFQEFFDEAANAGRGDAQERLFESRVWEGQRNGPRPGKEISMPRILIAALAFVILITTSARAQQVYGYGQNQMHTNEPGGPLLFGGPQSQWHTDRLGGPMILGPTVGGCNDCESGQNLDDNDD